MSSALIAVIVIVFFLFINTIKILKEYERGVIFRLGRFVGVRGPGLILLIPCLLYTSPSPRDRTRSRMPSSA